VTVGWARRTQRAGRTFACLGTRPATSSSGPDASRDFTCRFLDFPKFPLVLPIAPPSGTGCAREPWPNEACWLAGPRPAEVAAPELEDESWMMGNHTAIALRQRRRQERRGGRGAIARPRTSEVRRHARDVM
jgi:hypothetical protein